jgi:DNA-binding NarL/FixJ family response regulator
MPNQFNLTLRELEIVQLLVECKSNKEIASQLCISKKTVEFHLKNIYRKISVNSRTEAAVWAIQHGLQKTRVIPS